VSALVPGAVLDDVAPADVGDGDEDDARQEPERGEERPPDPQRTDLLVVVGLALVGDAAALELVAIERLDHRGAAEFVLQPGVQPRDRLPDRLVSGFDPGEGSRRWRVR